MYYIKEEVSSSPSPSPIPTPHPYQEMFQELTVSKED